MQQRQRIKGILFVLITIFFGLHIMKDAYAEMCPDLTTIKDKLPPGWAFYDSDDGTPLSEARIELFKKTAQQFALAEWVSDKHMGGIIHCYYRDKNGSDLEAYLAKKQYIPFNNKKVWYSVSGYMHCAASQGLCMFRAYSLKTRQHLLTQLIEQQHKNQH